MTIYIPTSLKTKGDNFKDYTDVEAVKKLWERKITGIKGVLNIGGKVAFAETGYGDSTRMPQELFVYLSEILLC